MPIKHSPHTRYATPHTRWGRVSLGVVFAALLAAYIPHAVPVAEASGSDTRSGPSTDALQTTSPTDSDPSGSDCIRADAGFYECTDARTLVNWYASPRHIDSEKPADVLRDVCVAHGLQDDACPKILWGMAEQESAMGKYMQGDNGRSQGYFHIMDYHNLPQACTYDLRCSATFSLERMIRYGFKTDRDHAIMAHNGTPGIPLTLQYLALVKAKMASWPE